MQRLDGARSPQHHTMRFWPFNTKPSGSLHVVLEAEESAQRADDCGHDRRGTAAIEVRTDRNRDLRHDDADDAANRHQPAKNRDDDGPVRAPRIVQIDDREAREQRQQAGPARG
jgi:hypothetical protein